MKTKVILHVSVFLTALLYGCTNNKPIAPKWSEDDVIRTAVKVLSAFEYKVNHLNEVDLKKEIEYICKDWERTNNDSAFLCKVSKDLVCQIISFANNGGIDLYITFYTDNVASGRAESIALYNKMRKLALESDLISENDNTYSWYPRGKFYNTPQIEIRTNEYDNGIAYICSYNEPKKQSRLEGNDILNNGKLPKTVPIKGMEFAHSLELLKYAFSFNDREFINAYIINLPRTEKYIISYVLPIIGDDSIIVGSEEFKIVVDLCKTQTDENGVKTFFYIGKDFEGVDYVVSTLNKTLKEMYESPTGSDEEYAFRIQNQYGMDDLFVPVINMSLIQNKSFAVFYKGVINDPDGYTNIRKSNNGKSYIIGKIMKGEVFTYWKTNDNWYIVQTESGIKGYVHKNRIKPIK